MNDTIKELIEEMESIEAKLKAEIDKHEAKLGYEIKEGYIKFEENVLNKQRENMKGVFRFFSEIPLMHLLTSPLVYAMFFPAMILDLMLFAYQNVIFRIYGFELIKRSDYVVFDRQYLRYLNVIEKFNCMYCSYFNGLLHYAAQIAGKTELYFCPIKHAKKTLYRHRFHKDFLSYGDGDNYQVKLEAIRKTIK